jgi:hypothetical protein
MAQIYKSIGVLCDNFVQLEGLDYGSSVMCDYVEQFELGKRLRRCNLSGNASSGDRLDANGSVCRSQCHGVVVCLVGFHLAIIYSINSGSPPYFIVR